MEEGVGGYEFCGGNMNFSIMVIVVAASALQALVWSELHEPRAAWPLSLMGAIILGVIAGLLVEV